MAPPKYDDLGKDAKDLLSKNYHFGITKFEGKTNAANGTTGFNADLTHNPETGAVDASLETKWKNFAQLKGLQVSEKFSTSNNAILSKLTYDNISNLSLEAETSFKPSTGDKTAKVKATHQSEFLHAVGDVDIDFAGPTINASAVFGYKGGLAGYQASYDTANSKLLANNVALGYKCGDVTLHAALLDATKFVGSAYHKINGDLAAAVQCNWAFGSDTTAFTFGLKKQIDANAFLKAKVDNSLKVGLSYSQNVGSGVQLTLSGLVNGKEGAGHKVGCHLNFEA